jgi:hypothetical protein
VEAYLGNPELSEDEEEPRTHFDELTALNQGHTTYADDKSVSAMDEDHASVPDETDSTSDVPNGIKLVQWSY